MSDQTFYVTTPIYYVNARPHIGHAYTTIVADVLARRHRLLGKDTFFLTGTDEHGQKIERSAAAAGIPPQQFADQVSQSFQDLWRRMGILRDTGDPLYQQDYIRTTDPRHKRGVQKLFSELYKNGFIYLASYTGAYCVSDEAFVDAPVGTPCPDCGRLLEEVTEENFFFKLSAFQLPLLDLIESNTLSITPESRRNEVLSFLRGNTATASPSNAATSSGSQIAQEKSVILSEARSAQSKDPDALHPAPSAQPFSTTNLGTPYVPGALKDLSISRSSFTWGIPVPEPAASTAKQPHVIYVWLDALANYMTALGYGSADETLFKKFWPADLHLVGKEIIRFHCVYWPAFLLAAKLPLPKAVTAHGWLLFEDSKMSKSRGNIVRTETILDAFGTLCPPTPTPDALTPPDSVTPTDAVILSEAQRAQPKDPDAQSPATTAAPFLTENPTPHDRDLFASDVLRYFLLREIPFGQDGSFSFDALITRYNADLANGYGNLVSRTLNLSLNNFPNGFTKISSVRFESVTVSDGTNSDRTGQWFVGTKHSNHFGDTQEPSLEEDINRKFANHDFQLALREIFSFVSQIDRHISTNEPWKLAKSTHPNDRAKLEEVLYTAAESIRIITALLYPILPYATARVWAQLGLGDIEAAARNGELTNLEWGGLKPGTKLGPLGPIFPRADKGLAKIMTDMENPTPVDTTPADPAAAPPTTAPDAAPRTTTLDPTPTLPVAGSSALTTGPAPATTPSEAAPTPETPQITIDDFAKIELRVAQIILAERIPKADKLLRLEVDLGPHGKRQILSGIAEFYTPEELTGRRIVVITNLAPRKMRGLESHGMLLAASDGDHGKPHLATCGDEIPLGARLK